MYPKANLSKISRNMGYTKIERIKDVHPKRVCHEWKDPWPKKGMAERCMDPMKACHMLTRCVKKKESEENYSPYQKRKKRSWSWRKEFSHTHCTTWLKDMTCVYLWIQTLTWQYMRFKYAFHIPKTPHISLLEVDKVSKWGIIHIWEIWEIIRGTLIFL